VKESSFTECNMMSNVSHSGGQRWQTIVVVQVISLKTVKEHQKQVVKVASIAGEFKNDPQRASEAGKKGKNSHGSNK
jgi:general stress protein YciG